MEAKTQVRLMSLEPYRHLFPPATAGDSTQKKGAGVSDTVDFIPKVVKSCAWQVEKFVDEELRGLSTYAACEKLWHFVKHHIRYEKDARGLEQVRSPRRLIHDGKGDCDCFTTFIDTCLYALGVKGVKNRITKYGGKDYFQHIYPIVPMGNGRYIVMDCVVDSFNYEEPYTEKKDYDMDLQFLDGIPERSGRQRQSTSRLHRESELAELGKLLKKKSSGGGGSAPAKKKGGIFKKSAGMPAVKKPLFRKPLIKKKSPVQKKAAKAKRVEKRKNFGKKALKVVNKVNKINPATVLLRGGILASMKLNLMKVAEKLKWGYATREFAQSKGMDMSKYDKLKNVLAKAEKVFYGAGGKPENLKKAILTGKGNKNHEVVAGLGRLNEYTSMPEMLGEMYRDEFVTGMEGFAGFGELGEPATAAAITAASGAMGALAALLASLGNLFPKKKKAPKPGTASAEVPADGEAAPSEGEDESQELPEESTEETPAEPEGADEVTAAEEEDSSTDETENLPATTDDNNEVATTDDADSDESNESSGGGDSDTDGDSPAEETTEGILGGVGIGIKNFWNNNRKWIVPVGISAAVITGAVIYNTSKSTQTPYRPKQYALSGAPRKRKGKKGGKGGGRHQKKGMIALM